LTIEFLILLNVEETNSETKIYFHFFNEQFEMSLKQFSIALGFHKRCILDPNTLATNYQYDRSSWWSLIFDEPVSSKNSIVSIHNPILRFLAMWLAMVVHTHSNLHLYSLPELQCLYAMVNKIHFSPIRSMIAHWQMMISGKGPIDMTSLVTRLAKYVSVLENSQVTYLPQTEAYQYEVSLEHFVQEHMMREGPGNSLFICYPGYDKEIELPCPRLSLYSVKKLTLQMEKRELAQRSVVGPQTRSRTRWDQQQTEAGTSQQTPPVNVAAQPGPST
jgi:hypothetical protein